MIEAVRWRPFVRWFGGHASKRIRGTFAGVHVHGLEALREAAAQAPLLLLANHTSWWDPMVALWLSQARLPEVETYGMMDAANLRHLRFFRWLGVFGVDRSSRRDGARATRYAIDLLRRPKTMVWVFPQGEEQPPHVPLTFHPGAAGIAKRSPSARVVPVALAYVFEGDERPHLYISIGTPMTPEAASDRAAQAEAVESERSRIRRQLESRAEGFEPLLVQQPSTLSRWATAALDALAGWLGARQLARRAALPPEGGLEGTKAPARVEP